MPKKELEREISERRATVLEENRNVTGRISDSCRVIGFGLLAIFYSARVGGVEMEKIGTAHPCLIWAVGGSGFMAIFFDYLQYASGARAVKFALKEPPYLYDTQSLSYRLRTFFYAAKQWAVFAGVVALGILLISI